MTVPETPSETNDLEEVKPPNEVDERSSLRDGYTAMAPAFNLLSLIHI